MNEVPSLFESEPRGITLLEFNRRIKALFSDKGVIGQWVQAETSDVRVAGAGHCYMELVQKDPKTGNTVAKIGATIWASNFRRISREFEEATHMKFASGIKVLVRCTATFHEQYGLKVVIDAVDPSYTLGDMVRRRMEILKRLSDEQIIDLNKHVPQVPVFQRIAVISAQGAAGYGDFVKQLAGNGYGLKFYPCLFTALMQGDRTVTTVMDALERIKQNVQLFDCVVIIRGGGSTTDLNWFDNYDLAAAVARFPLPVITGIGHDRDTGVLDYVAALPVKTPTAAAELIVKRGTDALARLDELSNAVVTLARNAVSQCNEQLAYYASTIPMLARHQIDSARLRLQNYMQTIPLQVQGRVNNQRTALNARADQIAAAARQVLQREQLRYQSLSDKVQILSPRNTLNRGYSLTMCNGHFVTDASQLHPGDVVTTHFTHGHIRATVLESGKKN